MIGHARLMKDLWIDKNNIHHREEGGDACDDFCADGGVVGFELKKIFDELNAFTHALKFFADLVASRGL